MGTKKETERVHQADFSQAPPTDTDMANWDVEKEARNFGVEPTPIKTPGNGQGGNG